MKSFALIRPASLVRAREAVLQDPDDRALRAGGIDLLDRMKEGLDEPGLLVELARVPEAEGGALLRGIDKVEGPCVRIGALTTLAALAELAELPGLEALQQAAREAATPSIRNSATLGGNLLQRPRCWYFRSRELVCLKKGGDVCLALVGDNRYHAILGAGPSYIVHPSSLATALLALDARAIVWGGGNDQAASERTLPLAELFVGPDKDPTREHVLAPGEILLAVEVPEIAGMRSAYQAVREKQSHDWPLAEAAVRMRLDAQGRMHDVRVALGHVAPIPWSAPEAAKLLEGQQPSESLFAEAAALALKPASPLDGNAYKVPLTQGLLREVLHRASGLPLPE